MAENQNIPNGFTSEPLGPSNTLSPRHPKLSHKALVWLSVTAVSLGVVSILLFFFGGSSFTESKVLFTIDGPTQASVGDEVVYKVRYENKTKTTLHRLKLTFNYPDGSVVVQDGKVVTDSGNIVSSDEDDLSPGDFREKEFHAFLVGEKGNIKTAKTKLVFDAGSIRSSFEKTAQISITITDVPVSLTLIGPPTSVSGQAVTYLLDYRNRSTEDISDLQVSLTYPDGFTPTKISPNSTTGNSTWNLPLVKKGGGGRITIQGTLSGREGDSKAFSVALRRNIDGTYVDYQKTSVTTVISSPLLDVTTIVNGSADYVSHIGDTLQYTIRYTNTSNLTLTGLSLSAKLEGNMYEFTTVEPRNGFFDSSARIISWNSTVIPEFNSLKPRATGTVIFSVKLKSTSGGNSVRAFVQFGTENVPDSIDADKISTTDDLVTKITSQPTLRQTTYYNDSAFGSFGPFPPQANKETSFTIRWQISNPGNMLNNAKLVATLPQGVTWKNVVSVSGNQVQPTFNKNTSQVSWNIGTLPAMTGVDSSAPYELAFQVSLKPSTTQISQSVQILSNPTLSGTDSFTNQNIIVNGLDLLTTGTVDRPNEGVIQ